MATQKYRPLKAGLAAAAFTLMCVSGVWANEQDSDELEDPFEGQPPVADQMLKFSNEIGKLIHREFQEFMDKELKRLKEERKKQSYSTEEKLAKYEGIVKENPQNAEAHFALGETYDEMREGASAIIHTQIAEQLFLEQKNLKGVAESRRNLRWFYEKYRFKPEDFVIN
ncbi:MAG: hypothetical protein GWM98_16580 [Nitrospinaceae bacterium]|nr:hypothetical protein [Nitrospinaceae bacterium]NIR55805.1 hypothetical protein [Nitrospinaceae bacterium]NIS86258.1 hypothetical protein [Nitrospinaceae bacterium]NIT83087.1 hypothetical protein [Nitrospinaceae bacterium]NIU45297.1 hypothetical protein [Nitrospinaceae bacterium]